MDMEMKYKNFFDIDPEYLSQINEREIESRPDLWKKFYPHETFVKLLKAVISVIERKQKLSIWVEGAYGTGKSHAVLTLKKLLDASEDDTKAYFDKYPQEFSTDLRNKFQQIKSGDKKILTVHRYGSSSINDDNDLVFAIQQSIVAALKKAGIEDHGEEALTDSTIAWLTDQDNKNYFNALIKNQYAHIFSRDDDVDSIIENLRVYSEQALSQPSKGHSLHALMSKIMQVARERQFSAMMLTPTSLLKWIELVIEKNSLKAIIFIWDEFTDYFRKNAHALTGFQEIVDFSGDKPFYLIIVTHNVTHMFPESEKDWKRLLGRFIKPICNIELPENMAFSLMGEAMAENKDPVVQEEWHRIRKELYNLTHDSRQLVKEKAKITDEQLQKILPIHPYAALLLQHISSAFDSNQRSMFDFIKNDRGDEIKAFQWFINNQGPYSDNQPFLTIDMLWDFFYERGKEQLAWDIRAILDCYTLSSSRNLDPDQERVLKTVLLLQAVSHGTGDAVELFIPNEKNLNYAFEGTDLANDAPVRIAETMISDILYMKRNGGKKQYYALTHSGNIPEINKIKEEQKKKPTSALLLNSDVQSAISLKGALVLRYVVKYVSYDDFKTTINQLRAQEDSFGNRIAAVATFAKDDAESIQIGKAIKEAIEDGSYNIVFIDASITPLGSNLLDQYAEAMANSVVNIKQDRGLAAQYEANAKDVLKEWRRKIISGGFVVYSKDKPNGERAATSDELSEYLYAIDRRNYSESLETFGQVSDEMWKSTALALGAKCGAEEITQNIFRSSNENTKLENFIGQEAWKIPEYWKSAPYLPISKIKIELDRIIAEAFASGGRISIAEIYDFLQDKQGKYGFLPCNLSSFVMGFLLKEYTDGAYNYSDGTINDVLSVEKLKDMIAEIIKHQTNPIHRYKAKYIVTTTAEERAFNEASSKIFGIPLERCNSVEQTRERIRQSMKELDFPIWVLKYELDEENLKADKTAVSQLIDFYCGIANNNNFGASKTDSDIAIEIGKLCISNSGASDDLASLTTKVKCSNGMKAYVCHHYRDGMLKKLAEEIEDGGRYINCLKKKFSPDAANWVWNKDTAEQKIDEVILEYQIVAESNKVLSKNISFDSTIKEWIEKCSMIRISYQYAKNCWEELSGFMEMLYGIKRTGVLHDAKKEEFLNQLKINSDAFTSFYNNQKELFKKACNSILRNLNDEEVLKIFNMLPNNLFTAEKNAYQMSVQAAVEKYENDLSAKRLKDLWREKTNTDNPREWSRQYTMPILCMIPDKDIQAAKAAFETLNNNQREESSVKKAIRFLEEADFFDRLSSEKERDKAFRENVVKSYSVMLDNLDRVKEYLSRTLNLAPYDWFGLPIVDKTLKEMAESEYNRTGFGKAMAKIDDMDSADVKQYLKRLIRDNMIIGMEIIKGK